MKLLHTIPYILSDHIPNLEAAEALARFDAANRDILVDHPIKIVGHACRTPIFTPRAIALFGTNERLSLIRAQGIAHALYGATPPENVSVVGHGTMEPLQTSDESRRVEIWQVDG